MIGGQEFPQNELPDLPYARQLKAGFPWLTFDADLEPVYRQTVLEEHMPHVRVNLCVSVFAVIAITAVQASVLGPPLNRLPSMLYLLVVVPSVLMCLGASFSQRRHIIYPPIVLFAA